MKSRIGLIVNPLSHSVRRKGSVLSQISSSLPDALLLQIDDFSRLPEQLAHLAADPLTAVFIEGGDGTLQAVLSAWPGLGEGRAPLPGFAILPGGSTNLAYKVAGFRSRSPDHLQQRVIAITGGAEMPSSDLRALRVEGTEGGRPQIGMLLSTGSLARAMIYTQKHLHGDGHRGSLAVGEAAARFVLSPERYLDEEGQPILRPGELGVDSPAFSLRGRHALSLMTTLPTLSLGLKPFWGQGAGAIKYTHAAWPIAGFRRAFLKILAGASGSGMLQHGLNSYCADLIELTCAEPVVLDGEILHLPDNARIRITPTSPIRFLR